MKISEVMTPDGRIASPDRVWYPSLKDPKHIPIGETSGTALFVLGLAWGAVPAAR